MEKFPKILSKISNQKSFPMEVSKEENNSQLFQGTEKYNNNIINPNHISILKDKNENNNNQAKISQNIIDLNDDNNNILGRIFLNQNKEQKYVEIFKNEKMDILEISPNITFLHSYSDYNNDNFDFQKFIGFRYYENGPTKNGNYFTIIKKNDYEYYILEKDNSKESVKDIENNTFYDKDLNCYEIMRKIIFEKQRTKIIGDEGDLFPEIIGYSLALNSIDIINNFKIIPPLIPNLKSKSCINEHFPEKIIEGLIYIEPFIYDCHISTILTSFKENNRINLILDMSHHHFNNERANFAFLPKIFKDKKKNKIFPNNNIQAYSSCCIWFYGIIEFLLESNTYCNFDNINNSLSNNHLEFYIDIINFLSKEIEGIENLIKIEDSIIQEKEKAKNIDFDRFSLFCLADKKYYSMHKDIIYNKFLDIGNFILNNFIFFHKMEVFEKTQGFITLIYELKNKLKINIKYYDLLPEDEDIKMGKELMLDTIKIIDKAIVYFKEEYDYAFYFKNMLYYGTWIKEIIDEIKIPFCFSQVQKDKIYYFDFSNFIKLASITRSNIQKDIENKTTVFSIEIILKELNSSNDICFCVMNK